MFAVFGSHCCCSSSSQLQVYALGERSKEHLGYSRQGCISDAATISLKDASSNVRMYLTIGIIGFISAVVSNGMASVVFLQVLLNPLQANLNFMRKRSVPKFIQNGGVRKSPDITAATLCAFFKLECR